MVSILCKKGSFFFARTATASCGDLAFCNAAGGEFFFAPDKEGKKKPFRGTN